MDDSGILRKYANVLSLNSENTMDDNCNNASSAIISQNAMGTVARDQLDECNRTHGYFALMSEKADRTLQLSKSL